MTHAGKLPLLASRFRGRIAFLIIPFHISENHLISFAKHISSLPSFFYFLPSVGRVGKFLSGGYTQCIWKGAA